MPLTLRPLHPLFVAEATGVDLRTPLTPEDAAEVHRAMDRYAVLVFPGQALDDDQQMGFGRALGTLEPTRAVVDVHKHRLKHQEMNDISNLDTDGKLLAADDRRRMFNLGNRLWHSDSSFKATPALYSMLHARVVPPEGGETEFADMRAAWDALPDRTKAKLKDLVCWHSLIYSRAQLGFDAYTEEEKKAFAPVPQRLVRRHPGSGRVSLYLSSHIGRVEGMPVPEGMCMIRDLVEHATQRDFVYRHAWKQHDLVMWDNRCTLHRARPFEDNTYPRDLRRVTLQDAAPTLEQEAA
ncbi:TauD/TfdA family dioxygenase [Roseomonas sp. PWR1]|uniref:TauD/TfdA family dioxygenase n=1 Tax=Roseomonas nitratireducens TaxID=2820810 RepID=A0ABS4AUX6_9PROT|nr:TauD/TfdA family dioxygenase [Neoroseomonas nitratireducens]MBP0465174.1 TauD/TfdA family dioxygenase [Neoroseomonas nitratireducens]